MVKLIYFDICALLLMTILLYTTFARKMTGRVVDKIFIIMTMVALGCCAADLCALSLDNTVSVHPEKTELLPALYWAHSLYLLLHNLSAPLYTLFVVSLTDTWHKLRRHKVCVYFTLAPIAALIIAIATNPLTGLVFTFDGLVYTRGLLFPGLYITTIFYTAFGIVFLLTNRRLFTLRKLFSIIAIVPLLVVAMLVQMAYPHALVEMYANAMGLLFITMTIQRPEEIVDTATGLRKTSAYVDDMKKNYINDKHVGVVMINSLNYVSLQSGLSYDDTTALLEHTAERLNAINREMKLRAGIYYIERGRFRFVLDDEHKDRINEAAERINSELKAKYTVGGREAELICCICCARLPEDISDFKTLMSFGADFHEKCRFTGSIMTAEEIFSQKHFRLMNKIDGIIENALANHKLQVYYQPIYSTTRRRFVSAEALLRLIDDEYGFVSPEIFIPAAEKNGLILRIGDYVLEEVCRFLAGEDYKRLGLDYIEVNLSVAQCMQEDLADKIISLVNKYGVSPDSLNLEITETAEATAHSAMERNLNRLSAAGFSFSLDDYGTGYSNIKRVVSMPLKIVKLDKSFVDEMNNPRMLIVVENTVKMLKDMDMEIVVEGIETQPMVERFAELRCDFIQGYYFSKPIPQDKFVEFILSANQCV